MQYTRASSPAEALRRLSDLVPVVVVTRGADGALAVDASYRRGGRGSRRTRWRPSTRPAPVTCSPPGSCSARCAAGPFRQRLSFANLIAALSVQHFGGSLSAPGWGDIADWWLGARLAARGTARCRARRELAARYGFLDDVIPGGSRRAVRRATATIAGLSDARGPGVKLTILGGGGFRVPLVHGALLGPGSPITELVLHDVDPARLSAIGRVLAAQAGRGRTARPGCATTTDLTTALTGADFVFSAIRVHGLRGRVIDEQVALAAGRLGQETTGAGGVAVRAADRARRRRDRPPHRASGAAGVGHQLHQPGRPGDRGDGRPPGRPGDRHLRLAVGARPPGGARARPRPGDGVASDYAGLNHLGWLRSVRSRTATTCCRGCSPTPRR